MSGFLVMPAVGSCIPTSTFPTGTGPIAISKPVGQGPLARNLPDDVKTIQEALNQVTVKGEVGRADAFPRGRRHQGAEDAGRNTSNSSRFR